MDALPDPVVRAVVQRYARLIHRLGPELGERPLVLPTEKFFPDTFKGDAKSLRRLVKRMREHAGMSDIPVKPVLTDAEEEGHAQGGSCGSGSCSTPKASAEAPTRLVDDGDGWRLQFQAAELRHPVALTATVARALAHVFLVETRGEGEAIDEPVELTVDLAAVALGFGELLLEGSHIYSKSCGGPSVAKLTALGPQELAVACVLFVTRGKHSARALAKELPATQREALDDARALIDKNPTLARAICESPERLLDGEFEPLPRQVAVRGTVRQEEARRGPLARGPRVDAPERPHGQVGREEGPCGRRAGFAGRRGPPRRAGRGQVRPGIPRFFPCRGAGRGNVSKSASMMLESDPSN